MNWNVNVQQQFGANYMVEIAYVGSRGRQHAAEGRPEPGAGDGRRDRPERQPAVRARSRRRCATSAACRARARSTTTACSSSSSGGSPNNFSVLNSYTLVQGDRPELGQRRQRDPDRHLTIPATTAARPTTTSRTRSARSVHLRAAVRPRPVVRRLAGQRHPLSPLRHPRDDHADAEPARRRRTINANRPNRIGDGAAGQSDDRPLVRHGRVRAAGRHDRHLRQHRPQHPARAGQFNIDLSLIKTTRIGRVDTELRAEAFNLLNHPQFAQPNGQFGNAAFGTITRCWPNPACALCGTTERQIQLAVKVSF